LTFVSAISRAARRWGYPRRGRAAGRLQRATVPDDARRPARQADRRRWLGRIGSGG